MTKMLSAIIKDHQNRQNEKKAEIGFNFDSNLIKCFNQFLNRCPNQRPNETKRSVVPKN